MMFGFATKAEKEAYKAGIRKAEKAAALASSLQADALAHLWEKLDVPNQTAALDRVNDLTVAETAYRENDNRWSTLADEYKAQIADLGNQLGIWRELAMERADEIGRSADKYKAEIAALEAALSDRDQTLERADASADRLREKIRTTNEALTGAQRRIDELVATLSSSERECNNLSRELEATKKISAFHFRRRKELEAKLTELINLTPTSTPIIAANLGLATTGELLDELKARATVNGTINYKTVDSVPPKHGGTPKDFQVLDGARTLVPTPAKIKDWATHGLSEEAQSEKVIIDFIRRNMKEIKGMLGVQ